MSKHEMNRGKSKDQVPGSSSEKNKQTARALTPVSALQEALDYGGGGYPGLEERSLRDYPFILLRYWILILTLTVIGVGISKYQTDNTPKLYRSTAMINIGAYVPPVEGPVGSTLREETRSRNYTNTQIRLLRSYTLAEKAVLENPDVLKFLDRAYANQLKKNQAAGLELKQRPPVALLNRYLGMISFYRLPDTTLVEIHATSTVPEIAAQVANTHAQAFMDLVRERRQLAANINLKFLKERHAEATKQLEDAENKLLNHSKQNPLSATNSAAINSTLEEKYRGLVNNLNNVILEKVSLESQYRELRRARGMTVEASMGAQGAALAKLKGEYEVLRKRLRKRNHPALKALKTQMEAIENAMKIQGRERVKEAKKQYMAAVSKELYLRDEFDRLHKEQITLAKHKIQDSKLRQVVKSAREVQRSLAKRLEDAILNSQSTQETVSIVDEAFTPLGHFSPNASSNLWTGCFLGMLLGVILAFLLDYLDNTVRSIPDLSKSLKAPVLGVIPEFSKEIRRMSQGQLGKYNAKGNMIKPEAEPETTEVIITENSPILPVSAPFSAESESFKAILAALMGDESEDTPRMMLVTSGQKRDGKTTLAVNLAASLAQMEEKTLLIDGDLRLPSAHKFFDLKRDLPGVTDYLTGDHDPAEFMISGGMDNLWFMPAGNAVPNTAALLRSDKMENFLSLIAEEFDYVIIDSSPLGPVADALLLARYVDGVALVVRSGETSKDVAESAVTRLRQVGAKLLGVVLNDSNRMEGYWKSGYRYGGYRYGRGRYSYYR